MSGSQQNRVFVRSHHLRDVIEGLCEAGRENSSGWGSRHAGQLLGNIAQMNACARRLSVKHRLLQPISGNFAAKWIVWLTWNIHSLCVKQENALINRVSNMCVMGGRTITRMQTNYLASAPTRSQFTWMLWLRLFLLNFLWINIIAEGSQWMRRYPRENKTGFVLLVTVSAVANEPIRTLQMPSNGRN